MNQVRTEVDRGVAVLVLDAPNRRNALDLAMVEEIVNTLDRLEADESVHALVVTGAPPAFCAGADLSHLGRSTRQGLEAIYEGFLRLRRCTLPTIAAVNGAAVGAGMNMALACDVRIAAESARFDSRFLQLGVHPGGGHTWMFQRIAGPQTTAAAVLFGQVLDGPEAERTGLAHRCVPDDNLVAYCLDLARPAADAPRDLVLRTKASIAATGNLADHADAVARELEPQIWSMDQPAFRDRLTQLQDRIRSHEG